MDLTGLGSVFDFGSKVLDKIFPDPVKAQEAKLELFKLQQNGELAVLASQTQLLQGQLEVNKVEAANPSLFVSGWRPAIGWTAAISLFTYYVPYCITATVIWAHQCWVTGVLVSRPDLGIADILGLTMSMLGIAGMRTYEKKIGVA